MTEYESEIFTRITMALETIAEEITKANVTFAALVPSVDRMAAAAEASNVYRNHVAQTGHLWSHPI